MISLTIICFVFLFFLILIFFSFPSLSPIPYFPSQKKDLELIIKGLDLEKNQAVVDLGAGSGEVIFKAADYAFEKKLNTIFFAIEINPFLVFILWLKRWLHPNKNNIKIIYADMFKVDLKNLKKFKSVVFYLYISPWFLEKTVKKINSQIKAFNLVSYMYSLEKIKPKKIFKGINAIYCYSFKFKK